MPKGHCFWEECVCCTFKSKVPLTTLPCMIPAWLAGSSLKPTLFCSTNTICRTSYSYQFQQSQPGLWQDGAAYHTPRPPSGAGECNVLLRDDPWPSKPVLQPERPFMEGHFEVSLADFVLLCMESKYVFARKRRQPSHPSSTGFKTCQCFSLFFYYFSIFPSFLLFLQLMVGLSMLVQAILE